MLVTPPFGASSNIALWRAYSKPPVELVVADLDIYSAASGKITASGWKVWNCEYRKKNLYTSFNKSTNLVATQRLCMV